MGRQDCTPNGPVLCVNIMYILSGSISSAIALFRAGAAKKQAGNACLLRTSQLGRVL